MKEQAALIIFGGLLSNETSRGFLEAILGAVTYALLPVIGLAFVYVGFMYVTARGDTGQVKKATYYFGAVIVATVLVLGSWAFANIAYNTVVRDILGL